MHDYAVLREALTNVSRWRGRCILVHAIPEILKEEKHVSPIIRDVLLLRSVGIDVVFSCSGYDETSVFVRQVKARGIPIEMINSITDIIGLVTRLGAVKVFFLCKSDGIHKNGSLVREMTSEEAEGMLQQRQVVRGSMPEVIRLAILLCAGGIQRVHLIDGRGKGALLDEILSSKGSGTMIYRSDSSYRAVRKATYDDAVDIAHMIRSTKVDSSIVEEVILKRVDNCTVFVVDDHVHATTVSSYRDGVMNIEYLAHSMEFEFDASEVLKGLLQYVIDDAIACGAKKVTLNLNRAPVLMGIWPWFSRLGFHASSSLLGNHHELWEKDLS